MTKKEIYDANPLVDMRTHINGEIAIKPYYYFRCGVLHVRYTVDRAIELTPAEITKLKIDLVTSNKQEVLEKTWNMLEHCIERPIIQDGIAYVDKKLKGAEKNDIR